jgi:hypothetical protein
MHAFTLDSFDAPPGLREDLPAPELDPDQLLRHGLPLAYHAMPGRPTALARGARQGRPDGAQVGLGG